MHFEKSREELQRIYQDTEFITGNYINTSFQDITQAGLILGTVACLLGLLMDVTEKQRKKHASQYCIVHFRTANWLQSCKGNDLHHWTFDYALAARLLMHAHCVSLNLWEGKQQYQLSVGKYQGGQSILHRKSVGNKEPVLYHAALQCIQEQPCTLW